MTLYNYYASNNNNNNNNTSSAPHTHKKTQVMGSSSRFSQLSPGKGTTKCANEASWSRNDLGVLAAENRDRNGQKIQKMGKDGSKA